jgi:hypothetical protein
MTAETIKADMDKYADVHKGRVKYEEWRSDEHGRMIKVIMVFTINGNDSEK